jgi:hypothetical protein
LVGIFQPERKIAACAGFTVRKSLRMPEPVLSRFIPTLETVGVAGFFADRSLELIVGRFLQAWRYEKHHPDRNNQDQYEFQDFGAFCFHDQGP